MNTPLLIFQKPVLDHVPAKSSGVMAELYDEGEGGKVGMLMRVPSGQKDWSICSEIGAGLEAAFRVNRNFA